MSKAQVAESDAEGIAADHPSLVFFFFLSIRAGVLSLYDKMQELMVISASCHSGLGVFRLADPSRLFLRLLFPPSPVRKGLRRRSLNSFSCPPSALDFIPSFSPISPSSPTSFLPTHPWVSSPLRSRSSLHRRRACFLFPFFTFLPVCLVSLSALPWVLEKPECRAAPGLPQDRVVVINRLLHQSLPCT